MSEQCYKLMEFTLENAVLWLVNQVQESSDSCDGGNTATSNALDPRTLATSNISFRDHQEGVAPTPSIPLDPQVLKEQSEPKVQEQILEPSPNQIPKSSDKEEQDNKPPISDQLVPAMEVRYVSVLHSPEVLQPITLLPPTKVLRRITALSSPKDPGITLEPDSPIDPVLDLVGRVQLTLQRAELKARSLHDERVQKAWARSRDLRRDIGRPSVPAAPPGPAHMVHPSTFTSHEGRGGMGAIREEVQNFLPSMSGAMPNVISRVRPYPLLYTPSYLSRNFTSLQRASSGQAAQGLGEHTTCSLPSLLHRVPYSSPDINLHNASKSTPNLNLYNAHYSPPHTNLQRTPYSPPHTNLHRMPYSPPDINVHGFHYSSPPTNLQRTFYSPPHTNLQRTPYSPPHTNLQRTPYSPPHTNLHRTPYSPPGINVHGFHYSSPHANLQRTSYSPPHTNLHSPHYSPPYTNLHRPPYSPLGINVHGAHYSQPHTNLHSTPNPNLSSALYNTYSFLPCGNPYHAAEPWLYQSTPPTQPHPSPLLSCTETYLTHVLQNIQSTVQSLNQRTSLLEGSLTVPVRGPQAPVMALYKSTLEEVQQMRRSLNLFRTQMMDLELTLMRQHEQVYRTRQEREEMERLQYLRSAVRHQLLQLEWQQDTRLYLLDQQMRSARSAGLYRHPMGIHAHALDRLHGGSNVPLKEPVSKLLGEQVSLWQHLGSNSAASPAHSWAAHSSTSSAMRPSSIEEEGLQGFSNRRRSGPRHQIKSHHSRLRDRSKVPSLKKSTRRF
ncbi:hypothetical protein COCON_G00197510 [Conger conger]|uniref:Sperm-specific antigen 2 C-terminal domain-containing protein n=1 Tax=Conger conger TaxID=82655 RepID=A0A9Q1HRA9_CONCO|nr:hypothetical protein COCON_G00197510 [Conger conger]